MGKILILLFIFLMPFTLFGGTPEKMRLSTVFSGEVTTFLNKVMQEVKKDTGLEIYVTKMPAKRALFNAVWGVDDGDAARIYETSKYYPTLVRVDESILEIHFFALSKPTDTDYSNWGNFTGKRVGYERGIIYIEKKLKEKAKLEPIAQPKLLFNLLELGRIDVAIMHSSDAKMVKNFPVKYQRHTTLEVIPLYVHLHKKHRKLAPLIAKSLKRLKRSGEYKKLLHQEVKLHQFFE
ncbi:MAG: transporter substrate-binding domain-containing protein [SAR324 cluster bacterium]|nr:transporter substrate-binding domain-containing protein [SAR324 cluster bacterium]